jgi:hypothetical protein
MIILLANGGVTYAVEGHGLVDDHPARCVHALTLLRQGQVRLTHLHQIKKFRLLDPFVFWAYWIRLRIH